MVAVDRDRVAAALPGYAVGPQLGAGGSGLVLAGRHRDLDRQVAIKVLATTTADPAVMDAYRTEARLLNRLDHPHIVRIHDFIARDDVCLLVMELLPGGPVDARRLTPPAACAVALAVAHALARSHQAGILHRDVKPANILFTARGQPKLTDFGIAKISEGAGGAASRLAGTPRYMAPEQIRRGRLGPATDIYGLGAVLHELLRGAPLFPADLPVPELFRRHVEVDPPPLPGVPEALAVVVQRALAKDPAARQPGGTVFAEELTAAADAAFGPGWLPGSGVTVVTTAFTSGTITPGTIDSGSTARGAAPVHVTDATRLAHPSHPTHA
ncbi:serine/threonine-protein kinase, partial [Frankia canadensis]|uniref:serine/threonine-protein kinase n=1 Tax=Frankia canadensis TaxID=1836972 RepID=UPI001055CC2A